MTQSKQFSYSIGHAKDPSPPSQSHNSQHTDCFSVVNNIVRRSISFLPLFVLVSFIFFISLLYYPNSLSAFSRQIWIGSNARHGCNLFDGKWVKDYRKPLYNNQTCPTIPESKNYGKYGKSNKYTNWRWKPNGCELLIFDAKEFLRIVRGKRMAFVGDSVSRNQMESLLCLLPQVDIPVDIQEKDAEDRLKTWYFRSHDFILMTLWTKFLVLGTERVDNGSATGVYDLHLVKIDRSWTIKLPWINYLIMSDGHWFFRKCYLYEDDKLVGCVYCNEDNLTDFGPAFAIRKAFRTSMKYVRECEKCEGLVSVVRTFSPAHFENGNWNGGGYCNRTEPLGVVGDVGLGGTEWEVRNGQVEEVEREGKGKVRFGVMDVTKAMMMRADAHPDVHWNNQWMKGYSDCVHWCMPGPVDTWNELLLQFLKGL